MKDVRKISLWFLQTLALVFLSSGVVKGQDSLPPSLTEPKLAGEWYYPAVGYVGSQLFRGEYFRGRVLLENGRMANDRMLAYNGLQDQLIWLDSRGGKVLTLDKGLIAGFVLWDEQGKEMQFRKIWIRSLLVGDTIPVFVQVLLEGRNVSLYVRRRIINDYTETYGGYVTSASRHYLSPAPVYFIRTKGKKKEQIDKINRKNLYAVFPDRKKEIRKTLRKNHLSLNNELQLIRAMQLIDRMDQ